MAEDQHVGRHRCRTAAQRPARELELTTVVRAHAGERAQQRALAGTVVTMQGQDGAGDKVEIHRCEQPPTIALAHETPGPKQRCLGGRVARCLRRARWLRCRCTGRGCVRIQGGRDTTATRAASIAVTPFAISGSSVICRRRPKSPQSTTHHAARITRRVWRRTSPIVDHARNDAPAAPFAWPHGPATVGRCRPFPPSRPAHPTRSIHHRSTSRCATSAIAIARKRPSCFSSSSNTSRPFSAGLPS